MAVYDYECKTCGDMEIQHGMLEPKLTVCPKCGGSIERKVSVCGGFILSGAGFYSNDYSRSKATVGCGAKPSKGNVFFADAFPDRARVVEKVAQRRVQGKPVDGRCFKDAGQALRESENKAKESLSRERHEQTKRELGI